MIINHDSGTEYLEGAVSALRAVLALYAEKTAPGGWTFTQSDMIDAYETYLVTQIRLGGILTELGRREGERRRFEDAVAAFHAALASDARKREPDLWAQSQEALGVTLALWASQERDTKRLWAAVAAFRAAQEVWARERVPLAWARTQYRLGTALLSIGEESGTVHLDEAVAALEASMQVVRAEDPRASIGDVNKLLARAKVLLAERRPKAAAE